MFGARSWTEPRGAGRRGFSIPMVLLFCSIMVVILLAFVQTRMNMKNQTRITFRQLKAHYLAQSGIQHALLKLRILPLESYDAAAISRGACPFLPDGAAPPANLPPADNAHTALLNEFISDVTTSGDYPVYSFSGDFPAGKWNYKAVSVKAIMAHRENDTQTHAIEIQMEGSLDENFKGVDLTTTDIVTRVVKISRSR